MHEVNNTKGHKAGDTMLCAVADAVKKAFGTKYTYRLGGDEFVAFILDGNQEELLKKKKLIMSELAANGYYVSIGYEGTVKNERGHFDVDNVVALAESIMYRDKWEYYQANNIPYDRGHFPQMDVQLEEEKQ